MCHIATVGGSFSDRGGQNMLEPAGYGCAVSFGPDTRNFEEIAAGLIEAGGAVRLADQAELESFVRRCLDDPPAADALGQAARGVVARHRGATEQNRPRDRRTVFESRAGREDAARRVRRETGGAPGSIAISPIGVPDVQ